MRQAKRKMLNSSHKRSITDLPAEAISEYENLLLYAIAQELSSLETFRPEEINAASLRLRRATLQTYLDNRETMAQNVAQSLKAGFKFNSLTEVM